MASFWLVVMTGVAWMALTREMSLGTFTVGALIGLLLWRIEHLHSRQAFAPLRVVRFAGAGIVLLGSFSREIIAANVEQLRVVLAPRIEIKPRWILFRTELSSPAMRAALGMMIAMTPGSLCYEEHEEEDGGFTICIHALDAADDDAIVARIRERLERPLLRMEAL